MIDEDLKDLKYICLGLHCARIAMNEEKVGEYLNKIDDWFRMIERKAEQDERET